MSNLTINNKIITVALANFKKIGWLCEFFATNTTCLQYKTLEVKFKIKRAIRFKKDLKLFKNPLITSNPL